MRTLRNISWSPVVVGFTLVLGSTAPARAAVKVAVIDSESTFPSPAERWCIFLGSNGYECTVFPVTGPTTSLEPFDVVVDLSEVWTDPSKMLAEHLRKRKGVIVWHRAPTALGIATDPTVRE
jgi:hypothetical protein